MITSEERDQILGMAGSLALPATAIAQTAPRGFSGNITSITSGTLYMVSINLPVNQLITNIVFVSDSTGESGGTHLWFALYDASRNLLSQTTDNTNGAAFTLTTAFSQALTTPFTTLYAGMYYLGLCIVATTMPTLHSRTCDAVLMGIAPILVGTSNTGLNTGTAPNPANALVAAAFTPYAYVT